ncbi:MAG TPA: PIN domain-containing protein [Planctomycetota bacterium]|nr:PIN domain-containing protein [Planctomycetota bacterium]
MTPSESDWVLVDTDIASFDFKGDTRAEPHREILDKCTLCLSFMSVAELEVWSIQANWGERKLADFKNYIEDFIVLDSSRAIARRWAEVRTAVERKGRRIGCADAWIAATALY